MRKDLGICLAEARRNGATLPVTALVDQFYAQGAGDGRRALGHVEPAAGAARQGVTLARVRPGMPASRNPGPLARLPCGARASSARARLTAPLTRDGRDHLSRIRRVDDRDLVDDLGGDAPSISVAEQYFSFDSFTARSTCRASSPRPATR